MPLDHVFVPKTRRRRTEVRLGHVFTCAEVISSGSYDRVSMYVHSRHAGGVTVPAGEGESVTRALGFETLRESE